MKQRRLQLPISVLLIVAIAIIVWKCPRPTRMAAVEPRPAAVTLPIETETVTLTPEPPRVTPQAEPAEPVSEDVESIADIVEHVDPMKMSDINRAVQKLRSLPPEPVAAYFVQNLKDIGTSRSADRDRLIMVANSLQSPAALPLWVDLAKRQTPRYPDEEKLRNPPHPTLESRFVDMEQLQAIRNIGLIAREDRAARRVLMEIILTPDQTAHRTLHREQAYIALKESDLAASLRVLKQLAVEDDLLKRL
ncbi:MAG TPA: hypothetical protein VE954_25310 [Oligoflexus sp.]|uniref:hypothetical protein n=1 Tax=Oligoflexus sp. TaxID=1971216 RepID=UPI002D423B2A|nr:hypothetical protein [Oligoflexus sp.]HYX36439.1 hypothetical protein [Oligoflexus sp.]